MSVKRPGLHLVLTTPRPLVSTTLRQSRRRAVGRGRAVDKQPLRVKAGPTTGTVIVIAKAAGDRATYEWQYSQVGEPWINVEPPRQAKKVIEGLVSGRTYQFRVRSATQAGRSDFGQVVTFFVG